MARKTTTYLVEPAWLDAHRDDPNVRLIEVAGMGQESHAAFNAGHIPGAVCWDWKPTLWDARVRDFPAAQEFAARMSAAGIDNATTVVVYGEPMQFGLYCWWVLRYCGHKNVRVLDGGRRRWAAEGRPLVVGAPQMSSAAAYRPAKRNERMRIGRKRVLSSLGRTDQVILDARSPEEFDGRRVAPLGLPDVGAERCGRIPGARHFYYLDLLRDDETFKPAGELRERFEESGAAADKKIVVYCRLSHRATVLYFAATELLGYRNVRVYDGSWTEWGSMVGMPIEL